MTNRTPAARFRLLAAATGAALCLFGCVDLAPPWDQATGGTGGKSSGSGGAAGGGGEMLDGAPVLPDPAPDAGHGGAIPSHDGGAGGVSGSDVGGDPPLPGSGGTPENGTGGAGGFSVDGPVSETGGNRGGGGTRNDATVSTGGIKGTGGVRGTGGRGNLDAAMALDGTSRPDAVSDAGLEPGAEVSADSGPDLPPDAPIVSPDLGPDLGPALGPDSAPDASPLLVGLVAYYKCDDTSGTTLSDSSGHGYHGTLHGGFSLGVAGKVGSGLTLAKSGSGYAALPLPVFTGLKNMTIATWIKVTTLEPWARVFDTGINVNASSAPTEGTKFMGLTTQSSHTNNLRWSISVNGFIHEESLNAPSAPQVGVWQHVVIVIEESSKRGWLYINGSPVVTNETTTIQPDDLGAIDYAFLGKSQFSVDPYFDGMIDEFRVYDRVLSASEVQALSQFAGP